MNDLRGAIGTDGREIALRTIERIAAKRTGKDRLADLTLQRVVDIAWRYQFAPGDRARARKDLREALQPEVAKRLEAEQ
jgi:hypothetical protein